MTNRAALFALYIPCLSSTVILLVLLMNPSIDTSMDVMSTDRGPLLRGYPLNDVYSPPGVGSYVVI